MEWVKDSSLALYKVLKDKKYSVDKLLTKVNEGFGSVSMHGVREDLMYAQAKEIGIALEKLYLPEQPSMIEYADVMRRKC
ncbi:MAG: diphthamide synthase (EF-2-diphthine--ammonia ligase) [Glaciecola sp.]